MRNEDLLKAVEGYRGEIAQTMCDMISIPSMSPALGGEGESKRADFLMTKLKGFDSVERVDVPDGEHPGVKRSSILAKRNGKLKQTVWVIAHIDTVPAGNLDDWDTDPFKGVCKDGKVYGRGAEDNGQSVISSIFASRAVADMKLEGRSLGIALVADEEMASKYGVCYLIDHGYFDPEDIFLVPDWGSPGGSMVEVSEKSLVWLQYDIVGKSVHASTPERGVNAFEVGAKLLCALEKDFEKNFGRSDEMYLPPRSTCVPTKADATVKNVNTIPGVWSFCTDIRVLPSYDVDDVIAAAKKTAASVAKETGAQIEVRELQRHVSGRPSSTDTQTFRSLCDAVEDVTGKRPKAVAVGGATCANFFRVKGYDAYVWETGGGTLHGPNEYVVLDNLINDAKVFATLFYNVCVKD